MTRSTARRTSVLLAALFVGCSDSTPSPTALQAPPHTASVGPILVAIGDAVVTSSAFADVHPAQQGHNLQPLSELPGGQLEGLVLHVGRGCDLDPYLADPAGAIALIERGHCEFREKALRAHAAGAIGLIVYDNLETTWIPLWSVIEPIALPGVLVRRATGLLLRDGTAPVTAVVRAALAWNLEEAVHTLSDAGLLSHGQTTSLLKKLELAAAHVESGNLNGALGVLGAFIAQVEELVADGVIAAEDGAVLIAAAEVGMSELAP
jgi:hypothetical protein